MPNKGLSEKETFLTHSFGDISFWLNLNKRNKGTIAEIPLFLFAKTALLKTSVIINSLSDSAYALTSQITLEENEDESIDILFPDGRSLNFTGSSDDVFENSETDGAIYSLGENGYQYCDGNGAAFLFHEVNGHYRIVTVTDGIETVNYGYDTSGRITQEESNEERISYTYRTAVITVTRYYNDTLKEIVNLGISSDRIVSFRRYNSAKLTGSYDISYENGMILSLTDNILGKSISLTETETGVYTFQNEYEIAQEIDYNNDYVTLIRDDYGNTRKYFFDADWLFSIRDEYYFSSYYRDDYGRITECGSAYYAAEENGDEFTGTTILSSGTESDDGVTVSSERELEWKKRVNISGEKNHPVSAFVEFELISSTNVISSTAEILFYDASGNELENINEERKIRKAVSGEKNCFVFSDACRDDYEYFEVRIYLRNVYHLEEGKIHVYEGSKSDAYLRNGRNTVTKMKAGEVHLYEENTDNCILYGTDGNLLISDGNGNLQKLNYDSKRRIIKKESNGNGYHDETDYSYSSDGNTKTVRHGNIEKTETRNELGNLIRKETSGNENTVSVTEITYIQNNPASAELPDEIRHHIPSYPDDYHVSGLSYDDYGRVTGLYSEFAHEDTTDSDGSYSDSYENFMLCYDLKDNLTSILLNQRSILASAYDAHDALCSVTDMTGAESYVYDSDFLQKIQKDEVDRIIFTENENTGEILDAENAETACKKRYLRENGRDVGILVLSGENEVHRRMDVSDEHFGACKTMLKKGNEKLLKETGIIQKNYRKYPSFYYGLRSLEHVYTMLLVHGENESVSEIGLSNDTDEIVAGTTAHPCIGPVNIREDYVFKQDDSPFDYVGSTSEIKTEYSYYLPFSASLSLIMKIKNSEEIHLYLNTDDITLRMENNTLIFLNYSRNVNMRLISVSCSEEEIHLISFLWKENSFEVLFDDEKALIGHYPTVSEPASLEVRLKADTCLYGMSVSEENSMTEISHRNAYASLMKYIWHYVSGRISDDNDYVVSETILLNDDYLSFHHTLKSTEGKKPSVWNEEANEKYFEYDADSLTYVFHMKGQELIYSLPVTSCFTVSFEVKPTAMAMMKFVSIGDILLSMEASGRLRVLSSDGTYRSVTRLTQNEWTRLTFTFRKTGSIRTYHIYQDTSCIYYWSSSESHGFTDEILMKAGGFTADDYLLRNMVLSENEYASSDVSQLIQKMRKKISFVREYDKGGRIIRKKGGNASGCVLSEDYSYEEVRDDDDVLLYKKDRILSVTASYGENEETTAYSYDDFGRLTSKSCGSDEVRYGYDGYGRLHAVTETSGDEEETVYYDYDNGNNISRIRKGTVTHNYVYDGTYPYRLNSVSGIVSFTYLNDNPFSPSVMNRNGTVFNLTYEGSRIKTVVSGNKTITYAYDEYGKRIRKTIQESSVNTSDKWYYYDGNGILEEECDEVTDTRISYLYDGVECYGFLYEGDTYLYKKDLTGQIDGILNDEGSIVVRYEYDVFGKVISVAGSLASTIGILNSIRYRGYYYDEETAFYWLSSRYYDPSIGRFISPDSVDYLDPSAFHGLNPYAYCGNDPVNRIDPTGHFAISSFLIGLGISALIGAVIGATTYTISEGISYAITGEWSWSWAQFAGNVIGGAIGGACSMIPGLGTMAAAGISGTISTGLGMHLQNQWEGTNYTIGQILFTSTINGLVSASAAGIFETIPIKGLNSGRGSYEVIAKQINTKFFNGTIKHITFSTFSKMLTYNMLGSLIGMGYSGVMDVVNGNDWLSSLFYQRIERYL